MKFDWGKESKNLLTIPGMGYVTSAAVLAEIGNIEKFKCKDGRANCYLTSITEILE